MTIRNMVYAVFAIALSIGSFASAQDDTSSTATTPQPAQEVSHANQPAAGQNVVTQADARKDTPRRLLGEIYNRYDISKQDLSNRDAAPTSVNYLGMRYKLDDDRYVSVRQTFTYTPSHKDKGATSTFDDTYINYAHNNIFKFGENGSFGLATGRIYLPTGDSSRGAIPNANLRQGRALAWFTTSGKAGPFDVTWHMIHDGHNQTKMDPSLLVYDFYNTIDTGMELFKGFTASYEIGFDNQWFKTGKHVNEFNSNFNFEYAALKPVILGFYVLNAIDVANPGEQGYKLLRDEQTTYKFLITATL